MPKKCVKRHAVTQPLDPSYRLIPLTQGQNAIVDAADYEWLNQWNWLAHWYPATKTFYAERRVKAGKNIFMHTFILDCDGTALGDHKNHNTLDNRRNNLRRATRLQNASNQKLYRSSTSGYKGVVWHKKMQMWTARVQLNKKRRWLGQFQTSKDAALAYDKEARKHRGEFAVLNFPEKL